MDVDNVCCFQSVKDIKFESNSQRVRHTGPPGPTLFTHFFIHFPARPGGSAGFSLVLRIFRIFEEKEVRLCGLSTYLAVRL